MRQERVRKLIIKNSKYVKKKSFCPVKIFFCLVVGWFECIELEELLRVRLKRVMRLIEQMMEGFFLGLSASSLVHCD